MKLTSFLLVPLIAIFVYVVVKNLNLGSLSSSALITVLATALFTALLYISQSGRGEGSLKSQNEFLKSKNNSLEKEKSEAIGTLQGVIEKYKSENAELKGQIDKYINREIILSKYPFDARLGIRKHKDTGEPICPKCILSSDPIVSPLTVAESGWDCPNCGFGKTNPNWTPPRQANSDWDPFS